MGSPLNKFIFLGVLRVVRNLLVYQVKVVLPQFSSIFEHNGINVPRQSCTYFWLPTGHKFLLRVVGSPQKNTRCVHRRFRVCNLPILLPCTLVSCCVDGERRDLELRSLTWCSYSCIKPQRFGDSGLNREVFFAGHFGILHCSVFSFGPAVESTYYCSTRLVSVEGNFVGNEQALTGSNSLSRSPFFFFFFSPGILGTLKKLIL